MFNLYWLINNPNVEGKIAGDESGYTINNSSTTTAAT